MAVPNYEQGAHLDATIAGGLITTVPQYEFSTEDEADAFGSRLEMYHAALAAGPLAVADLHAIKVVEAGPRFKVACELSDVPGPFLPDQPFGQRREAVRGLIAAVAALPQTDDALPRLCTPLRALECNFKGDRAAFVAISPPYSWGEDGLVQPNLGPLPPVRSRRQLSRAVGTLAGAISSLVPAALPPAPAGTEGPAHLQQLIDSNWYADLLPPSLSEPVCLGIKDRVVAQLTDDLRVARRGRGHDA